MVERQDIDALLIGALYGELTPADEARLAAHLESHPTDRAALDGLTHARSLVRDSRVAHAQVEPPQALSALLLQEASRSAPRRAAAAVETPRESWFFRFLKTFASQPAMAAAAMLVLVVGAAGVVKMRDQGKLDEPVVATAQLTEGRSANATAGTTLDQVRAVDGAPVAANGLGLAGSTALGSPGDAAVPGAMPTMPAAPVAAAAGSAAAPTPDDVTVALADVPPGKDAIDGKLEDKPQQQELGFERAKATGDSLPGTYKSKPMATEGGEKSFAKKGIVVTTPQLQLKDDEDNAESDRAAPAHAEKRAEHAGPSGASPDRGAAGGAVGGVPAPMPAPAPVTAPAMTVRPSMSPPPPPPKAPAAEDKQNLRDQPAANGREEHREVHHEEHDDAQVDPALATSLRQAVQLTRAGKCDDAARIAASLAERAPAFYAAQVATNMDLKKCLPYIAAEQRARAAAKAKATAPAPPEGSKK